jgi:two-component system, LuxR family, response regulator FixJ
VSIEPIVYVVDDDPSVQRVLERTLTSAGWRVQMYESGPEFLDAFDPDRPGCLILDLRMPRMNGLTVQEKLMAMGSTLPIIFLTAFGDVPTAVQAMQAGAVDFLEKPFSNQQLLRLVEQALEQEAQLRAQRQRRAEREARLAHLTPREREVLDLVVAGDTNKEIAAQLGIGLRTVEMHRQKVMRKLGVRSAVDLMHLLYEDDGGLA